MTVTAKIRTVLENHLNTTPASPAPALPPVAYDNVPFSQAPNTSYVQAQFAPMSRRPAVRGPAPEHRHSGLFVLTICAPENQGPATATALVDKLLDRFNGSTSIQGVDVNVSIEYSEAEMGYHRPPFYCVPVRVGWYAYA